MLAVVFEATRHFGDPSGAATGGEATANGCAGPGSTGPGASGAQLEAGTAAIFPSGPIEAGSLGAYELIYAVGDTGLGAGESIRITFPGLWSNPQTDNPSAAGYTVLYPVPGADLELSLQAMMPDRAGPKACQSRRVATTATIYVRSGRLETGSQIALGYGVDGPGAVRAPALTGRVHHFDFEIDDVGDGRFESLTVSPTVEVVAAPADRIRAFARQSMLVTGEQVDLEILVADRYGNRISDYEGTLDVSIAPESTAQMVLDATVTLAAGRGSAVVTAVPQQPGTVWFVVRSRDGSLRQALSNPVWIRGRNEGTPRRLDGERYYSFWGDLHVHTRFSADATSMLSASETYEAAIDDTNLHFLSITDHDANLQNAAWTAVRDATNEYNCTYPTDATTCHGERHFVTLLGLEWTSPSPYTPTCDNPGGCFGHRNVYFVQDDGGDIEYTLTGDHQIPALSQSDEEYDEPCEMWTAYDDLRSTIPGFEFITVPHHVAAYHDRPARTDWDECPEACGLDAQIQPLVEIYSRHGSGESSSASFPQDDPVSCRNDSVNHISVRDGLKGSGVCGHRLGFIGSSDAHDGRPGQPPANEHAVEVCPTTPDGESMGEWEYRPYRALRPGLVCAFVAGEDRDSALTRQGIFEALQNRAVYATTGVRINAWLEMRAGGTVYTMGQEMSAEDGTGVLAIAHADKALEDLASVELLWLDPATDEWQTCTEWSQPGASLHDAYNVGINCMNPGTNVYYLKVVEEMGLEHKTFVSEDNRWIDIETEEDGQVGIELAMGWYSLDGLAAHVQQSLESEFGTEAGFSVTYDTADQRFMISASGMNFDLLWRTGDHGEAASDSSAATLLGFEDSSDETGDSYYVSDYANLTDGWSERHMAWTSPIWIDVP